MKKNKASLTALSVIVLGGFSLDAAVGIVIRQEMLQQQMVTQLPKTNPLI